MSAQQLTLDLRRLVNLNAVGHQSMAAIDAAAARFWQSESADNFIAAETATACQESAAHHSEQQAARRAA